MSSAIALMALQLIVLDPGHGGRQPGAVAPDGTPEKSICLQVALRLARLLKSEPNLRVLLTRRDDRTLSLKQRAEIANRLKPAVFISIHANSSRRSAAKGVETYYLSSSHSDRRARLLAKRENADLIETEEAPTGVLEQILKDADAGRMIGESARLARLVQTSMVDAVGGNDRSVRQAPFAVLVRSGAAAILVELGFLSNPEELKKLKSTEHQDRLARGLAKAIRSFVVGQQPRR
ncbi:MAG: N-acetylmuramoyl-L-alanine amidase [Myxococcota bacterium]|nr:N-acetylmuramoyl-L-alanine amidase [Myxococcota bacterium]